MIKDIKFYKEAIQSNVFQLFVEGDKQSMQEINNKIENIIDCLETIIDIKVLEDN